LLRILLKSELYHEFDVSSSCVHKRVTPEMWLTDTGNTLHTLVPSTPPPKPPDYPRSVEENTHISYEAYDPFSCCLSDQLSILDGRVGSIVWRTVIQWVSVDRFGFMVDTRYITDVLEHTVWVSRRRTFIAEGTDTSLVMYVSTAFTTSIMATK